MGTGGYAGWGYIDIWPGDDETNEPVFKELQEAIQKSNGSYKDMEWVLMRLNALDWDEYTKLYGTVSANALLDCIAANAFGNDQEIRTIYILGGVSGLSGEIKHRYISLLKELESYDKALFERCVKECGKTQAVRDIMEGL